MSPPPVLLLPAPVPAADVAGPAGWRARDGFALPDRPWDLGPERWLCVGSIAGPDDAEAAVTALARGVGLAVVVAVQGELRERVLEDLHRVGAVQPAPAGPAADGPRLSEEQRLLLAALAGGTTLGAAAAQLHISRRTAHRRMADIRRQLGVATTAEAVTRAAHPPPDA